MRFFAIVPAISFAASILRSCTRPSPARSIADEMIVAASASPSALMTEACLSCSDRSTTNLARSASAGSEGVSAQIQETCLHHWFTLLCNLLLLDSLCELLAECEVCQGDIFQKNVELPRSLEEILSDPAADDLSLSNKLCCVELRNNSFQNFVTDGR